MQTDLIDTFLDLMETNSFNRTAERLGVKQSTISTRMQTLEAQLGAALFQRSRAGTRPTAAGLGFLPHARALRHEWNEARRLLSASGEHGTRLRIGLQSDLATNHIADWVPAILRAIPGQNYYIEADFSLQMSEDILSGSHDIAILYTPFPHPDLHYERLGDVTYRMISTKATRLAEIAPESLIPANYSPSFEQAQRLALPFQPAAPVASGLSSTVCSLLRALGGSAYVLERAAAQMLADGTARLVQDAPPIAQAVHSLVHVRRRHVASHRRLQSVMRAQFRTGGADRPNA